jgi:hypothetical protein
MLLDVNARTEFEVAGKEVDFRADIQQAKNNQKENACSVEPLHHNG